jgi:protein SCO1/2
MPRRTARSAVSIAVALVFLAFFFSCEKKRSPNEKHYELKGKVVSVEKDKHLVTVAHEEVKDYMPAMTMPFTLRDDWAFEVLVAGDNIAATLVVDGAQSWLEDVVITQESADTSTPTGAGPAEPKPGDEVPNYRLINQDSKVIRINDYRGKTLLLTFIYTRCPLPDQCSLMSNNFATIDQELQKKPELLAKTHLLSISFDPEYDTPKVLRSYGAAVTGKYSDETFSHWEFASGSADEVKGIAQFFGLRYYNNEQSGNQQIIHSLRTAIIGPDGKLLKLYRGNEWKPETIVSDLVKASPEPTKAAKTR